MRKILTGLGCFAALALFAAGASAHDNWYEHSHPHGQMPEFAAEDVAPLAVRQSVAELEKTLALFNATLDQFRAYVRDNIEVSVIQLADATVAVYASGDTYPDHVYFEEGSDHVDITDWLLTLVERDTGTIHEFVLPLRVLRDGSVEPLF